MGLCVREDVSETTTDDSCFVPHYVTGPRAPSADLNSENASRHLYKHLSPAQKKLMAELYDDANALEQRRHRTSHTGGWWFGNNARNSSTTGGPSNANTHGNASGGANPRSATAEDIRQRARRHSTSKAVL